MKRMLVPCPSPPKEISVREHDYSIRLIKIAGFPPKRRNIPSLEIKSKDQYEVTELCIEPFVMMNVVKVFATDGTVTQLSTNIPLEDACHSENALQITPIDDLMYDEDVAKTITLNDSCRICFKNVSDAIPIFDDFGQITAEIANISDALESMNIEITNDNNPMPKQMCVECFNVFTKMALFKQICKRSKRALINICEFVADQQQAKIKVEEDHFSILYDVSPDIIEIKEEPRDSFDIFAVDDLSLEKDNDQSSFICNRCGTNLVDRNALVHHHDRQLCIDAEDPECYLCNEKLPTVQDLDQHLENGHNSCYPCTKCIKSFDTASKLKRHQSSCKMIERHEPLICDFCSKCYFSKRSMHEHLKSHVMSSYPCHFCKETFPTAKSRGAHQRSTYATALYKCSHCLKEFRLKDMYRVHVLKHNPDKRYKCTYCPSQFVHRHHLDNHIRTHTKETPFLCNFCGKTFRGEAGLRDHLSTHDPIAYPHRRRNMLKKAIECKLCDFTAKYSGNLKRHIINEHGQPGLREIRKFEYSCHICDKEFRQFASLENHLPTHDEVRDFHCTYCKASFRKANYLRLHIDGVHLNKRPNKCDQCDAAYLISNDLKRHKIQKHSTERPFQCYYCQKAFKLAINLKVHINKVHQWKFEN